MLRTSGKTKWHKIKVGEVFAWEGCWCVLQKVDKRKAMLLASNEWRIKDIGCVLIFDFWQICSYHKLSPSVQRLWKEE